MEANLVFERKESKMKNIIVIQHTQAVHHTNGMIGSLTEWELTDFGKTQAECIGKNILAFIGNKEFVMYSSNQIRARQTADIIGRHLGLEYTTDDRLREQDLGEAVGKSVDWAHKNTIVWMKNVDDRPFSGTETKREKWNKLLPFVNRIIESNDENVILISHGGTVSIFAAIWLGLKVENLNHSDLSSSAGGVSIFQEDTDGKHTIKRLNDMSFLKE